MFGRGKKKTKKNNTQVSVEAGRVVGVGSSMDTNERDWRDAKQTSNWRRGGAATMDSKMDPCAVAVAGRIYYLPNQNHFGFQFSFAVKFFNHFPIQHDEFL